MAIVKFGGGAMERAGGTKVPAKAAKGAMAKKAAKHAVKKHAAKKHAAKHAEKHAAKKTAAKKHAKKAAKHVSRNTAGLRLEDGGSGELARAFHHLQRAVAVISLVEKGSGGDLRQLLEEGVGAYRAAVSGRVSAKVAAGLLRAAEHLGMAGLVVARAGFRVDVPEPGGVTELGKIARKLQKVRDRDERLAGLAGELLRRAEAAGDDAQMEWELAMAVEGLIEALEGVG